MEERTPSLRRLDFEDGAVDAVLNFTACIPESQAGALIWNMHILHAGGAPMGHHASYKYLTEKLKPDKKKGVTGTSGAFSASTGLAAAGTKSLPAALIATSVTFACL